MAKEKENAEMASEIFSIESLRADALKAEGFEQVGGGTLLKLDVGQAIRAKYVAKGGYESPDEKTGELKVVNTYELETPTTRYKLLGTTVVDQSFASVPVGSNVVVARYPDQTSGRKRKVHDIRVFKQTK